MKEKGNNSWLVLLFRGPEISSDIDTDILNCPFQSDLRTAAHMCARLKKEIEQEKENLMISIHILDGSGRNLGLATVNVWVMIEDSCSVLRHVRGAS